ncbi:MAG: 16S rRNA (uracil(1498)-N(3))-methyltransferase [Ferruginibacter sp.]|nr:16S rRNA (uracil(1498)-N(3))-methyltransferase [Ferruginibacter sp.]
MPLPFFYTDEIKTSATQFVLNEETSRHVVQVLRMQHGEYLLLTDGNGNLFNAEIIDDSRKKCAVKILSVSTQPPPTKKNTVAISLVKNSTRFEWFIEKATEIGINEIVPLLCIRTEKQHFRRDRMKSILTSSMLQSQQSWLPQLHEPVKYNEYLKYVKESTDVQKFIAHCEEENSKKQLANSILTNSTARLILIGPEGDFTKEEIAEALQNNFLPVSLGNTRLRTETAGVVAATLLCNY